MNNEEKQLKTTHKKTPIFTNGTNGVNKGFRADRGFRGMGEEDRKTGTG